MSDKPLSQNAIGRELGLSPANMSKMKKQGCPTDSVDSVRAWRKAKQNIAARKPEPVTVVAQPIAPSASPAMRQAVGGDAFRAMIRERDLELAGMGGHEDLDDARTRLMTADANMAEMKEAEMQGKFLKKTEVDSAIFEISRAMRDGLTNCARRIAADVAALTSAEDCEAIIDREHRALLDSMTHRISSKLGASTVSVAT